MPWIIENISVDLCWVFNKNDANTHQGNSSMFIIVKRYREIYAPGNWVGEPYWQPLDTTVVVQSILDASAYCHKEDSSIRVYFEPVEVLPMTTFPDDDFRHWRVFSVMTGVKFDLGQ